MSSSFTGGKGVECGREILQALNLSSSEVTVSRARRPRDAEELSRKALRNGAESILVAAGDEAINGVVNGFFEGGEPVLENPRLGIIPTRGGGDLARDLGISNHVIEAVGRIEADEPSPIDLGRVVTAGGTSRYFANAATVGIGTEIGRSAKSSQWLKKRDGDLAFNWTALKTGLLHSRFPLHISIPKGPQSLRWDANCVAVCNGKSFGGGLSLAPEADLSDGFLDVIVVHDLSKTDFLKSLRDLRRESEPDLEGVSMVRTSSVLLSSEDPERKVPIDIDGRSVGNLPARFDVVPSAAMLY